MDKCDVRREAVATVEGVVLHAGLLSEVRLETPERDTGWCTLAEQMIVCSQGTSAQGSHHSTASLLCRLLSLYPT